MPTNGVLDGREYDLRKEVRWEGTNDCIPTGPQEAKKSIDKEEEESKTANWIYHNAGRERETEKEKCVICGMRMQVAAIEMRPAIRSLTGPTRR